MEGFQDTNPGLFRMAQHLRQQNVLAIFYPQHQRGSVWLAHSRASSDFNFLNWDLDRIPESSPVILSVRTPLPSISSLTALANKPNAMGTFGFDDTFVGAEEPTNSALETQQATNLAHQAGTGDISAPGLSTPWLEVTPNHVLFGSKLEIKLDDLTQLNDSSRAEIFFLHFPRVKEEDEGFEKMQKWLVHNGMTVYSNRDEDGWSRFLDNSRRGVVIVSLSSHPLLTFSYYAGKLTKSIVL